MLRIANGLVFDPRNGVDGEIRDVCLEGGRIVAGPAAPDAETIDASGCAVLPGGVEIHSHVAGGKVNTGRIMCPEDHTDHFRQRTAATRAGCGYTVPTTFLTGYEYARLGYTTLFEAAVPPLLARHAHEELRDIPLMDSGCYTLMGNNYLVMKVLSEPDEAARRERLRGVVAWLLRSTRGYAVKIVNPGGVESWKWNQGAVDLDTPVRPFGVTSRQIVTGLAEAADEMGLPHPIHLHTNHLGEPGNVVTTLETMRALAGHRVHFTHLQFVSYDATGRGGYASGAPVIAEYFNAHPEFTCDVGQLVFGPVTTMTADAPMEFRLHNLQKHKWGNVDVEMETGSGVVPMVYRAGALANAVQWCTGLELMLLIDDPWRIFLTTDHPNAGPFVAYPLLIRLLMDLDFRRSWLDKLHPRAKRVTCLHDLTREYTLPEIAIVTRGGPARALGLARKGHLGAGADADVAVYPLRDDRQSMFSNAAFTIKGGRVVVRDGEVLDSFAGRAIAVETPGSLGLAADLTESFEQYSTVQLSNYAVQDDYVPDLELIPCG
jgi:formylmethanofuran dehydrogenase subunit A